MLVLFSIWLFLVRFWLGVMVGACMVWLLIVVMVNSVVCNSLFYCCLLIALCLVCLLAGLL